MKTVDFIPSWEAEWPLQGVGKAPLGRILPFEEFDGFYGCSTPDERDRAALR